MKKLYVVAHTESQHHVDGLVGGWFDASLTEKGRRDAARVADALAAAVAGADPGDVALISSDLKRTVETAQPIAERLGLRLQTTTGLREMSFGSAGGKPQAWLRERETFAPEGNRLDHRGGIDDAETRREIASRISAEVERIAAAPEPIHIVVTHGFATTFLIAAWVRMPVEAMGWVHFNVSSGSITQLAEDDVRRNRSVVVLNDSAHLR